MTFGVGLNFGDGLDGLWSGSGVYPGEIDASQPLITLNDAVVRLGDRNGGYSGDVRGARMFAKAVRDALRDLPTMSNWSYYRRNLQFVTSPTVTRNVTSSVAIPSGEFDGGFLRLQITDADEWPSDVVDGEVVIGNIPYTIGGYDAGTKVIVVDTPAVSFTGAVEWNRRSYKIPKIRKLLGLWDSETRRPISPISPQELTERQLRFNVPGTVVAYAVRHDSTFGKTDIVFSPPPSGASPFTIAGVFEPSHPQVVAEVLAGSGVVITTPKVFTHPNAKQSWVGSLLRINQSSSNKEEDLRFGEYDWQSVVCGVVGTSVTMTNPFPSTIATETILLSSLIDIDIPVLQTYFESLCHQYYCRNYAHEGLGNAIKIAQALYMEARSADSKYDASTKNTSYYRELDFPIVIRQ